MYQKTSRRQVRNAILDLINVHGQRGTARLLGESRAVIDGACRELNWDPQCSTYDRLTDKLNKLEK